MVFPSRVLLPVAPGSGGEGTCWKYLAAVDVLLGSWESCSRLVFTYCHRAWTMARAALRVQAQQPGQAGIQFELGRLSQGGHEKMRQKESRRG